MVKKKKYNVKEVKRIPKKDIIIPDFLMRQLQEETDSDIKGLSSSLSNGGMINEVDVRQSKDIPGKYELIAGARRFVATKEDDILAKVFVDMSNLRARILCFTENYQRKDPESIAIDNYLYETWKEGKDKGEFTCIRDLADEIGMEPSTLGVIIYAGEQREKNQSSVMQHSSSYDIHRTKDLEEHSDIREDLLKKKQDNKLTSEDMGKISEEIKSELDKGTQKEVVKKVLTIVDNAEKQKDNTEEQKDNKDEKQHSKEGDKQEKSKEGDKQEKSKEGDKQEKSNEEEVKKDVKDDIIFPKISEKKFTDTLNTYKKSPTDIQQKLEKKEIDVGDAKLLNQFDTPKRREQVLNELKTTEEVHNLDKNHTVDVRLKQQADLNSKGITDLRTKFDAKLEEDLRKKANKDQLHDQECLDRYQRMSSYILETVSHFHPRNVKGDIAKTQTGKIFRGNYELFNAILVELGVIKNIVSESEKWKVDDADMVTGEWKQKIVDKEKIIDAISSIGKDVENKENVESTE